VISLCWGFTDPISDFFDKPVEIVMKIWEIYTLIISCTPIPVYSFQKRYLSGFLNCCISGAALQSAPIDPLGCEWIGQNVSRTSNCSVADNFNLRPGIGRGPGQEAG
jgi:hypothetical protein